MNSKEAITVSSRWLKKLIEQWEKEEEERKEEKTNESNRTYKKN